jgi:hypothetical protein
MAENPLLKLLIRGFNLDKGADQRYQERSKALVNKLKTPKQKHKDLLIQGILNDI